MRIANLIEQFEPELLARHGHQLLPGARRALSAMKHCRDAQAPHLLAGCTQCLSTVAVPHSCGHRSCPHCQHHDSEQWLARQRQRLLPLDYFLVTFTLPQPMRALAWTHQRQVYDAMLHCAWRCLDQFARNDAALGVELGATAVLHTHNRRRDYHPHVHLVVPAGGVDIKHNRWRRKDRYLFNARNLAKVFRGKLLAAVAALDFELPSGLPTTWIADCRNVGRGEKALGYLGRYLYRGVLSERDIVACHDGQVSFRYTESKSGHKKIRTLPGADFLWLMLRHVLPKGFRRARDYGILHPRRNLLLQRVQYLLQVKLPPPAPPKRPAIACPHCGAPMRVFATRLPGNHVRASIPPIHQPRTLPM